jgi:hypothetical protein
MAFNAEVFGFNQALGGGTTGGTGAGAGSLPNIASAAGGNLNDIAPAAGPGVAGEQPSACAALTDEFVNDQLNNFAFGDLARTQREIDQCQQRTEQTPGG